MSGNVIVKRLVRASYYLLGFSWILLLTSCQYQFGQGGLPPQYTTISVPYVEEDQRGELTAAIIHRLESEGTLRYVTTGGDLLLKAKWIDLHDENIGFRYDRKQNKRLRHIVIPSETRTYGVIEISLIDANSGQILKGPVCLSAHVEFDHDYYKTRDGSNVFSLGQLTDIDAANDTVMRPLNKRLAEQIVDYLINSW